MVMASGKSFLANQKIIKKSTSQKTYFFRPIFSIWRKKSKKRQKWGSFWVPPGVILRAFFSDLFFHVFWLFFDEKIKKKWKSWFGYVNYSVSWGSPGWKKQEKLWKITLKKTSIFHEKSTPYRVKKLGQNKNTIKIDEKTWTGHFVNPRVDF